MVVGKQSNHRNIVHTRDELLVVQPSEETVTYDDY